MMKQAMYGISLWIAGWSGAAAAATAVGPICDTAAWVNSTTYYDCDGVSYHGALDMANGTCSEWNHRGMISGAVYYAYYGGCYNTCGSDTASCQGGAGNHYIVSGGNGWQFRQLHVNATGESYSKTCDRCVLGLVGSTGYSTGAHVHADNRQYGTKMHAWYQNAGTTCGSGAYCGYTIGYPTL